MKKLILFLVVVLTILITGCATQDVTCNEDQFLIGDTCFERESLCQYDQTYENGTCVDIVCDENEVIENKTCVQTSCLFYEELVNGECEIIHDCETDSDNEICAVLEYEHTCIENGNSLIDGVCYGENQTCQSGEALVDNICRVQTACEIDSTSEDCLYEELVATCISDGKEIVDGECVPKCSLDEELLDGVCVDKNAEFDIVDIYYLNDFHGALLNDGSEIGISRIGNFIIHEKETSEDTTFFITGGDILQGSALSNYFLGESTIELFDLAMLDAFILGNHEFDWGLDEVTKYFDEIEENGEADYPLLAANVFLQGTTTLPDYIDQYTILEDGDIRVGVIGIIGPTLESSIATSKVSPYDFVYPIDIVRDLATNLRTNMDCDAVIVVAHDSGGVNSALEGLSGDARIDAIFNGHSHQTYVEGTNIPIIQSGGNGRNVGHVELYIQDGVVISAKAENLSQSDSSLFYTPHPVIEAQLAIYQEITGELFNEPIIEAGEYLSSGDLTTWIAHLMHDAVGADIAFQNHGGTRRSIDQNTMINLSVLYEVWPFDNIIKTVYLTGAEIKSEMGSLGYYTEVTNFIDDQLYLVATNDYVFDKPENPYIYGTDVVDTGFLMRDLAVDELFYQAVIYEKFYTTNDIQTTSYYD